MSLAPRAVVVHRATELEQLIARHGTRQQVGWFLKTRGRTLDEVDARHQAQAAALTAVNAAVPADWRRGVVERGDLDRFVWGPDDVVIAVGQDGLVANVAKYLDGQVVVGVNPEPDRNPGVLVPHPTTAIGALLAAAVSTMVGQRVQSRAMVGVVLDDGQRLAALNELYIGHPSHQSARYRLTTPDGRTERHSSSGVLVGTGTGATGWCRSAWVERRSALTLPQPADPALCWFVREAWPSPATGTELTEGVFGIGGELTILAESDLVVFGDGIEGDHLKLSWGQTARVSVATKRLHLLA